jgi:hypothetical protein
VLRHYSNRSDLLVDLNLATNLVERLPLTSGFERQSVYSAGRVGRVWALQDRLSEETQRAIAEQYAKDQSCTRLQLAEEYGVSRSSITRILRRFGGGNIGD